MSNENAQQPAQISAQSMITNLQITIEVLREEREAALENLLGCKVNLRSAKNAIESYNQRIDALSQNINELTAQLTSSKANQEASNEKVKALLWHLNSVVAQEVDNEYVAEVIDLYRSNEDAKRRRANQLSVAKDVKEQQGRDIEIASEPQLDGVEIEPVEHDTVSIEAVEEPSEDVEDNARLNPRQAKKRVKQSKKKESQ